MCLASNFLWGDPNAETVLDDISGDQVCGIHPTGGVADQRPYLMRPYLGKNGTPSYPLIFKTGALSRHANHAMFYQWFLPFLPESDDS